MIPIEINDIVEIGRQLKEARESKNLTVEEIANRTKLRKDQVIAIEEGNLSSLPPITYVKGFIKLYSKAVGLEITDTAAATVDTAIPPRKVVERRPMKRSSVSIDFSNIIFLVLFVSIVALTVFLTVRYFASPRNTIDLPDNPHPIIIEDDEEEEEQTPIVEEPVIEDAQIVLINENNKYVYEVTNQENLEVTLLVDGQCWVDIRVDGDKFRDGILNNEELTIEADESITMRIGLPASVDIMINGQTVEFSDANNAVNVEINLVEKNGE